MSLESISAGFGEEDGPCKEHLWNMGMCDKCNISFEDSYKELEERDKELEAKVEELEAENKRLKKRYVPQIGMDGMDMKKNSTKTNTVAGLSEMGDALGRPALQNENIELGMQTATENMKGSNSGPFKVDATRNPEYGNKGLGYYALCKNINLDKKGYL